MKINVFVVQLESIAGDIKANIKKVKELLGNTKNKPDLIVLPELWTTGWDCPNFEKYSEKIEESQTYEFLKSIAIEYNSNVIGGSAILQKKDENIRNTSLIFDRKGNLLTTYDKFHLFSLRGESEASYLESGETPVIVKTDIGKIGISICYDIRFPEMFRLYAFNDVDIIVNMAAWPEPFKEEYVVLSRARAIENQTYFISASLTGKIDDKFNFAGNSMVVNYQGSILASLDREERVLECEIDLGEMKKYKEQMPILKDTKKIYQILEK